MANGDLDVYLPYQSEDEVGILTESVQQLIDRLKNIIDDEKYLFQEIGSENFEVKSTCEQAYRGDFAPILYSIASLMSRLEVAKRKKEECRKLKEAVERESANRGEQKPGKCKSGECGPGKSDSKGWGPEERGQERFCRERG